MKTIVHLSDLHFGTERPEVLAALEAELLRERADLVVVSGDLTQRARTKQFVAARAWLDRLPEPRLIVPGNHDIPLYDVVRRFLAPLVRYRRHISPELDPLFDDGTLFVAGLNTARSLTWKSGRISVEQMETLRQRLQSTRSRFRIVVTHHPFIPPPFPESGAARIDLVGRAARTMTVLSAGAVDVLLAGHLHHSYAGDTRTRYPTAQRGIVAIQAGTAVSRRVRDASPNAFNRLRWQGDELRVEVWSWNGSRFACVRTSAYVRGDTGWSLHTPAAEP